MKTFIAIILIFSSLEAFSQDTSKAKWDWEHKPRLFYSVNSIKINPKDTLWIVNGKPTTKNPYPFGEEYNVSVDTLKPDIASAIYGSMVVNGAFLITVKKGNPILPLEVRMPNIIITEKH